MGGFLCALPVVSALFSWCGDVPPLAVGYVEGDYVLVAPIETAQISEIDVRRGDRITADQPLAQLERRDAEIAVAQAGAGLARASLDQARWRLDKRTLSISQPGVVFDIIRNAGEVAGPQAPVISVLPDGATKLRLFLSERDLSRLSIGSRLNVRCDGCGTGMTAIVSYIATDPEFTPPVIYSTENRQKLVYLIKARPDEGATALKPGQIVDVVLESPEK